MALRFPYKLVKVEKLGQLEAAYQKLLSSNTAATAFIKEIEAGNLDAGFQSGADSEEGLSRALLSMQHQLQKIAEEEKERNWESRGLAMFADILRSDNSDIKAFYQKIISELVKYLEANQGGLFLVNDLDKADTSIELVSCYAYNRQKYLNKKIRPGEGLVGQCFLEKETIFMTDLPQDYVSITSGLGTANPACLAIVPLKVNEEVHGFVELAGFQQFKSYQIEFIERVGEIIASSISTVKINQHTRRLLEESQEQAEQMRAQEEEMRQNMEELQATQEDMQRVLKEVQEKEKYTNELMDASKDTIFSVDLEYKLYDFNARLKENYKANGIRVEKGMKIFELLSKEEKDNHKRMYDRAFRGETFEVTDHIANLDLYYLSTFSPLRNEDGEIYAAAVFAKDISDLIKSQKQTEQLLAESQQKEDELRAQEEELRQNMEELHAIHENQARMANELRESEQQLKKQVEALDAAKAEIEKVRKLEQERADERVASQRKATEKAIFRFRENEQLLKQEIEKLKAELSESKNNLS